ncbi:MAG: hypothetical protein L0I76_25020 [Pseudonocardia sp.]|nr:hypothetical protein [Pseudonocardia sp.]
MPEPATDELLTRFTDPAPQYGPLPIWWWSGATVTRERLREQMRKLIEGGVRQAVVLCLAPTGPTFGAVADDPPFLSDAWIALFDGACADAEELGFTLWLYDQIGFSGANFQGRLIAENPSFAGRALYRTEESGTEVTLTPPAGHEALAAYAVLDGGARVPVDVVGGTARWSGAPARLVLVHAGSTGFDYFSPDAGAALLGEIHGVLERGLGHRFGTSIGGFFQDELPPMPTWGHDFAATFAEHHGYDLVSNLWALYEHDAGDAAVRVRRDYHAHRAALGRRGFMDQHDAWFRDRGLTCGFDQASPAREGSPVGGVSLYGDYLGLHTGFGAPGSDHWGDAKVHSSLAHGQGHERVWIEAFHSSGWGGTLEETYDWLSPFLRRGANLYDPHAVYYSTVGGWWEWAPPSTCWRQPYWPSYPVFAGAVSRLCSVLTAGHHVCDVLVVSPTSEVQGHTGLAGTLPEARRAGDTFLALGGVGTWFAEQRGALERAGIDHDAMDEATLARGEVMIGDGAPGLRIGDEAFRTVVLPGVRVLDTGAARVLLEFADAGGRVLCVRRAPELFLGGDAPDAALADRMAAAVADGSVTVVADVDDVPGATVAGPVQVRADAPFLLRRTGDTHVLALIAHDDGSGTTAPMMRPGDTFESPGYWGDEGWFSWEAYNSFLRGTGYDFRAPGDRVARVHVRGLERPRAQAWSPGRGTRAELDVVADGDGWALQVPFDDGSVALVVLGADLPAPTATPLGPRVSSVEVPGPWHLHAESTLDNSTGDLAAPSRTGTLPIEIWRFEHATGEVGEDGGVVAGGPVSGDGWAAVTASFGPFAQVRGPWSGGGGGSNEPWRPVEWSRSRGIHNDPLHVETLGPKGQVPEEFVDVRPVEAGQRVEVRTHLLLPGTGDLHMAVGASAPRRVWVDGVELDVDGVGHQSFSALPERLAGHAVAVHLEFTAHRDGPVRALFAVVTDVDAFRRPEQIRAGGTVVPGSTGEVVRRFVVDATPSDTPPSDTPPSDTTVHVSSDGACAVLVNGTEVGRQGDFNPYPEHRHTSAHTYDIGSHLRTGENTLTLRLTDQFTDPTTATLDSPPVAAGGLGLLTGEGWTATRDGEPVEVRLEPAHRHDPRYVCRRARPHPLPGAAWLDPAAASGTVVADLVPDLAPDASDGSGSRLGRTEWLRLLLPPGSTTLRIPTDLDVVGIVDGHECKVVDGVLALPGPSTAGTHAVLRLSATDGRRGGALLDGPIEVEVTEAQAPLDSWEELGLRALGGKVTYRSTLVLPAADAGGRAVLDLGEVRGTADVWINGVLAEQLVWGPWRAEVTGLLTSGENTVEVVVRGTLAGYLDDASPTRGVYAGQVRTGLFGPVRLHRH